MTRSADGERAAAVGPELGAAWRAQMESLQSDAVAAGGGAPCLLTCPAPLDAGGLGRHLREIEQALGRASTPVTLRCTSSPHVPPDSAGDRARRAMLAPLSRVSRAWRMWDGSVDFDRRVAGSLPAAEQLIAFNGTALAQLAATREAGWQTRMLVSANSHYEKVMRQHALAHAAYPVDRPWVTHLKARNLREYEDADRILYSSEYIRESFLERGFADNRLARFPLTPHPRYTPRERAPDSATFDVVYVGSLTVHKGVPLLIDALGRLRQPDIRLVLVGGYGTRGMRRFLERARDRDPRLQIAPGDPLGHLQRSRVCVHPVYEDGFGYAPAEALACGVPVIVSEDTGMKELISSDAHGLVLPTGNRDALVEAIDAAYDGSVLGGG